MKGVGQLTSPVEGVKEPLTGLLRQTPSTQSSLNFWFNKIIPCVRLLGKQSLVSGIGSKILNIIRAIRKDMPLQSIVGILSLAVLVQVSYELASRKFSKLPVFSR